MTRVGSQRKKKNNREFHKENKCHFPTACVFGIINIQSDRKDLQTKLFVELLELLVSSFAGHAAGSVIG